MLAMSIYNASNPSSGDSHETEITKTRVKQWVTNLFRKKGYKTWIYEEVTHIHFDDETNKPIPYHLDLAVLTRNKESIDDYHFFGIELDWKVGHGTKINDRKDKDKDNVFAKIKVPILRFRMENIYGRKAWSEAERDKVIWDFYQFMFNNDNLADKNQVEKNKELSIRLKENVLTTCRNPKCKHKAAQHTLSGCEYRTANKAAMYCNCDEPFIKSDM